MLALCLCPLDPRKYSLPLVGIPRGRIPFWAVRRSREASECNMNLLEMKDIVVHAFAASAQAPMKHTRRVHSEIVTVPLLVNEQAVRVGDELVWL